MYGPGTQARQLLITRRLLERGVRFIQVWSGTGQPWDNHERTGQAIANLAGEWDQPIAAFLTDLKQRGLSGRVRQRGVKQTDTLRASQGMTGSAIGPEKRGTSIDRTCSCSTSEDPGCRARRNWTLERASTTLMQGELATVMRRTAAPAPLGAEPMTTIVEIGGT